MDLSPAIIESSFSPCKSSTKEHIKSKPNSKYAKAIALYFTVLGNKLRLYPCHWDSLSGKLVPVKEYSQATTYFSQMILSSLHLIVQLNTIYQELSLDAMNLTRVFIAIIMASGYLFAVSFLSNLYGNRHAFCSFVNCLLDLKVQQRGTSYM